LSGAVEARLFADCDRGAVPPVGEAYGIPTVWDDSLGDLPDVYFEGGDHRTLIHMSGPDFAELMRGARPMRHFWPDRFFVPGSVTHFTT
jgi:Ala-tRNA(Pro) deacylase